MSDSYDPSPPPILGLNLPLFELKPISSEITLEGKCSYLNNALVGETLSEIVIVYGEKVYVIPLEVLEVAARYSNIATLALKSLINDDDYICISRVIQKLAWKRRSDNLTTRIGDKLKTRTPSFSAILAKAISDIMLSKVEVMVNMENEIVYVKTDGRWLWGSYAENYLIQKAEELGEEIARNLAERLGEDVIKIRSALTDSTLREAVKGVVRQRMVPPDEIERMISEGMKYIGYRGGFINVDEWFRSGVLIKRNDVDDAITVHKLPQDEFRLPSGTYDSLEDIELVAQVHTPLLLDAMRKWVPDHDKRLELWKAMAYTIYPKMPFKKFFIIVGPPNSGKTTFLEFLKKVLGPENTAAVSLQQLLDSRSEYYAALLHHKLANLSDEGINSSVISKRLKSLELLKVLVGGATLTARTLYSNPFEFKNYAKLFFATNDGQAIDLLRQDPAIANRMVVIPFKGSFKENQTFKEKLFAEAPKALPVLLVALRVLAKEGFVPSAGSINVKEVRDLCRRKCIKRTNDLFLPASVIRKELGLTAKELSELLKSWGIECHYTVWRGRRGLSISKDFTS